jgi:hypothetical protein
MALFASRGLSFTTSSTIITQHHRQVLVYSLASGRLQPLTPRRTVPFSPQHGERVHQHRLDVWRQSIAQRYGTCGTDRAVDGLNP